jgi:hypothetical protein
VTVPVEGGGRAEVVTDAHTRGEGAMAAVCAVTVEGDGGADGGGASFGAVWGVGDEAAVCVGALQMLVAHVVGDGKALGEGVDAVVRLDGGAGGEDGGGGELVVQQQAASRLRHGPRWVPAGSAVVVRLLVSGRAAWLCGRSHHRIHCSRVQVDGRVGFEAAVSAATGELRAGVAAERGELARMQRSYRHFRAELARMGVSTLAKLVAERDAARAEAAARTAERDAARASVAGLTAERDAVLRRLEERGVADDVRARLVALQQVVSDLRCDLAAATEREEMWRRAEAAADDQTHRAAVTDAIARKVATPLTTAAANAYLRGLGFPAGSQPAGITWGIDTVPADRLTASSKASDSLAVHPGSRLMYTSQAVAGKGFFATAGSDPPGEWVRVDLGGTRSVVGALVQGYENAEASAEGSCSWHRHKFQWSADGATWTDVDGGRVWSRDGLASKDVSAAVFGAPVRCRYMRIVAVSTSGFLRWEVVVLP